MLRNPPLFDLFPPLAPYSSGFISVDDIHTLYWEQSGNPDGVPVLFLHGGPGGGASPRARQFFDPDHYRIIVFDQRGAGRSMPLGSVQDNTLAHLLSDIERIREHLKIERWHLFGGSWGSTLSIAYAIDHPQRCISMTLYGIFLLEQPEIDWFLYGIRSIFPEAWEQFSGAIAEDKRYDLLEAYYELLTTGPMERRVDAAINWTLYESACVSLLPNFETLTTEEQKHQAYSMALIETHYFRNQIISEDQSLLNKIDRLRAIPASIIHGRYDVMCPILTAHKLHQLWPEADYVIVPDAGHSSHEPGIRSRLIEATEHAKRLK
ncbi:MAG: Proline iminopeptidase [Micavibrio sp.]|nr:Proline iminopeptidase [Micavibrio sp.]